MTINSGMDTIKINIAIVRLPTVFEMPALKG